MKLFADGGYRCAMRVGDRVSGFLFYDRAALAARMLAAWRTDRNVVCHALGNLGVETAVGAIEDAFAREPAGRRRVRIDHAMFLDRALLARLVDLGVWAVVQPSFIWDHGGRSPSPDLMLRPFATARAAGLRQAFSSDYPCGENAPLLGIQAAVTRRSRLGEPAGLEEALSAEAALRAYTLDAARAAGLEADRAAWRRVSVRISWSCLRIHSSVGRRRSRTFACSRRGWVESRSWFDLDPSDNYVLLVGA